MAATLVFADRGVVTFDPESYANLRDIGALSKRKRVALLCVEDELAICHCKVLVDIMLRDRMVDAAVAIEPESLVPGAGRAGSLKNQRANTY